MPMRHALHRPGSLRVAALLLTLAAPASRYTTRSLYTYRIAASSSGKHAAVTKPENGLNYICQSLALSSPGGTFSSNDKLSGEDAFFLSHIAKSQSHVVLGLADGVGGWRDAGVDPGLFSHGLCKYMAESSVRSMSGDDLRPRNLLSTAFDRVMDDQSIAAGGATATVATCEPDGRIEVANLGDSGYAIFEPNRVAYTSPAQTHAFNTPYQLTKLTPRMRAQQQIFDSSQGSAIEESPAAAAVTSHELKPGSVLVLATDGVWDNLEPSEILTLVGTVMTSAHVWVEGSAEVNSSRLTSLPVGEGQFPSSPSPSAPDARTRDDVASRLAFTIMRRAKAASLDGKRDGPFAREAKRYYPGDPFRGGKVDDIAVLVAIAVAARAPDRPSGETARAKL